MTDFVQKVMVFVYFDNYFPNFTKFNSYFVKKLPINLNNFDEIHTLWAKVLGS